MDDLNRKCGVRRKEQKGKKERLNMKEYAVTVLEWMKETIHKSIPAKDIVKG